MYHRVGPEDVAVVGQGGVFGIGSPEDGVFLVSAVGGGAAGAVYVAGGDGVEAKAVGDIDLLAPRQRATARPRMLSPPQIAMATIGSRVDTEVFTVRVRVAFRAVLTVLRKSSFGCRLFCSRIRSKITTLSLMA